MTEKKVREMTTERRVVMEYVAACGPVTKE